MKQAIIGQSFVTQLIGSASARALLKEKLGNVTLYAMGGSSVIRDHAPVMDDGYGTITPSDRWWLDCVNGEWQIGKPFQDALKAMRASGPQDVITIMLGEGDSMAPTWTNADAVYAGYRELISTLQNENPGVVIKLQLIGRRVASNPNGNVTHHVDDMLQVQERLISEGYAERGPDVYDMVLLHDGGTTGNSHLRDPLALAGRIITNTLEDGGYYTYKHLYSMPQGRAMQAVDDHLLQGTQGTDRLYGNAQGNVIRGGLGNDTIDGGAGNDYLIGGGGADAFVFRSQFYKTNGVDTLADFSIEQHDRIWWDHPIYASVTPLSAQAFVNGTKPNDANDRFLYDRKTGNLFFDENGAQRHDTPVLIAKLPAGAALSHDDIYLF